MCLTLQKYRNFGFNRVYILHRTHHQIVSKSATTQLIENPYALIFPSFSAKRNCNLLARTHTRIVFSQAR